LVERGQQLKKKNEMTKTKKKTTTLQLCVDNNFPYPRIYSRAKNKNRSKKTKKKQKTIAETIQKFSLASKPPKAQSKQRLLLV
jgi:hypothetical protein